MTDETSRDNVASNTFNIPGIHETGEGSLLAHTRNLVAEQGKASVEKIDIGNGDTALIKRRPGGEVEVLEPLAFDVWRARPFTLAELPQLTDLNSLIAYTNRFKDADSVVFANDTRTAPSIATVLDYHRAGAPLPENARHGEHVVNFPVPLSDEWKAWTSLNGKEIAMANFARFLEDHIVDVLPEELIELSPEQQRFIEALGGMSRIASPAKLMELATGLQVFTKGELTQSTRLQSGEGQLTIKEQHQDGQGNQLIVPSSFVIAIPVFRNGDRYQIVVRLRYRVSDGLKFFYELWRNDLVFDHAFNEAVTKVAEETALPVYRGARA